MIEYAGLGVCVANGEEEIKKKADYITLSNEDDGVAYVLDKFILNT
jgi:hydroxymethylpyrimidine pyrophosphatase-like HAD family hydrolase